MIILGVLVALVILIAVANQRRVTLRWLDVALGASLGGVIGARIGHVLLNQAYFSQYPDQIVQFSSGGLDWHTALIGSLLCAWIVALLRRVEYGTWLNTAALAFPFIAAGAWIDSVNARATYGVEVRTLADFPAWIAVESPNVYGEIAPRLNLLPFGLMLCLVALGLAIALTIVANRRRLNANGSILAWTVCLFALGMAVIEPFRADQVTSLFNRRADQILDLIIAAGSVGFIVVQTVLQSIVIPRIGARSQPRKTA